MRYGFLPLFDSTEALRVNKERKEVEVFIL